MEIPFTERESDFAAFVGQFTTNNGLTLDTVLDTVNHRRGFRLPLMQTLYAALPVMLGLPPDVSHDHKLFTQMLNISPLRRDRAQEEAAVRLLLALRSHMDIGTFWQSFRFDRQDEGNVCSTPRFRAFVHVMHAALGQLDNSMPLLWEVLVNEVIQETGIHSKSEAQLLAYSRLGQKVLGVLQSWIKFQMEPTFVDGWDAYWSLDSAQRAFGQLTMTAAMPQQQLDLIAAATRQGREVMSQGSKQRAALLGEQTDSLRAYYLLTAYTLERFGTTAEALPRY